MRVRMCFREQICDWQSEPIRWMQWSERRTSSAGLFLHQGCREVYLVTLHDKGEETVKKFGLSSTKIGRRSTWAFLPRLELTFQSRQAFSDKRLSCPSFE